MEIRRSDVHFRAPAQLKHDSSSDEFNDSNGRRTVEIDATGKSLATCFDREIVERSVRVQRAIRGSTTER